MPFDQGCTPAPTSITNQANGAFNFTGLDLDANAFCGNTDPSGGPGSDTENIIYKPLVPTPVGHYVVKVDHWAACSGFDDVHFVVTIRNHGQLSRFEGSFSWYDADQGGRNSGVKVAEFDVQ